MRGVAVVLPRMAGGHLGCEVCRPGIPGLRFILSMAARSSCEVSGVSAYASSKSDGVDAPVLSDSAKDDAEHVCIPLLD